MEDTPPNQPIVGRLDALQSAPELLPLVYQELRRLAVQKLAQEKPGQTLQATALVHEALLRLEHSAKHPWNGRAHFFAAAAEVMSSQPFHGIVGRGYTAERITGKDQGDSGGNAHA